MVLIALSGCDGSGKTTIATSLDNILRRYGVKAKYRREFEYFLLKYLLKLLGSKVEIERKKFLKKDGNASPADHLKYKLWPFLVWLDSNLEIAYLKLFNRSLIIFDRSIVDHLAGFEYLKYINRNTRNLLLKYSLKPGLIIVLDAPPEVMYERKKETHDYRLDFYREQRERYLDMAMELKVPIIRTDKSLDESLRETLQHILLRFGKKEDIVLHALSDPLGSSDGDSLSKLLKNIDWDELDLRYLIVEASKNNVEYPFYERLHSKLSNCIVRKALRVIELKYQKFLKVLTTVTELFEKSGIDYVVFKTISSYKYLPRDIDVLVGKEDFKKAMNLLVSKGFKLTKTHTMHKEISLVKNEVEIDLHLQIGWMGSRVIDENLILHNYSDYKVGDTTVRIPNPTHEFLLLSAHAILQHHYVTLGEVHYARALIKNYDIDWDLVFSLACKHRFYKGLTSFILLVVSKDVLFYGANIEEKISNIYKPHLMTNPIALSFTEILKPVTWLGFRSLQLSNILNFMDMIITICRRLRHSLIGLLPYNEPLREILSLFARGS